MKYFTVYSYTFSGDCDVRVVEAKNSNKARFAALLEMGSARVYVQHQAVERNN